MAENKCDKTSNLTVAIALLARDCGETLEKNISMVETIGGLFRSYKVIIYENDSKDNTKEILSRWAEKNHDVTAIMENSDTVTIPEESRYNPYPAKSKYRIEKMARFRNRLMEEVEKINPDVCIFMDIDLCWIDPLIISMAIDNAPKNWGGLFGNGKVICKYSDCITERPFLYDSYAYVDKGVDPYKVGKWLYDKDFHHVTGGRMYINVKNTGYYPCTSAFNNIGIYKWEAIRGLRYEVVQTPELESVNVALCEHVPFNLSVEKRGYGNYIVEQMVVYSEYREERDYTKWHNRWKKQHVALHYFIKHRGQYIKMQYHRILHMLGLPPYTRRKE